MDDFTILKLKGKFLGSIYQRPDRIRHFKYLGNSSLKKIQITSKKEIKKDIVGHYIDFSFFRKILDINFNYNFIEVEVGIRLQELNNIIEKYGFNKIKYEESNLTINNIIFSSIKSLPIKKIFTIDQNLSIEEVIFDGKNLNLIKDILNKKKLIYKLQLYLKKKNNFSYLPNFKKENIKHYNLIIGGSSGLGLDIAYELASKGKNLYLISSSMLDLVPIKKDLEIRFRINVKIEGVNFEVFNYDELNNFNFFNKFVDVENIFFTIGRNIIDDNFKKKKINLKLININLFSQISFLLHLSSNIKKFKVKNIIFISSISSFFASGLNLFYGMSKRALNSVVESFYFSRDSDFTKIQHYISGPLDTNMILSKKSIFPPVSTKKFAKLIISNLNKDVLYYFYPKYWRLVILILKFLPWRILRYFQKKFINFKD